MIINRINSVVLLWMIMGVTVGVQAQDNSPTDLSTANTLLHDGKTQEALNEYLKMIRIDPRNVWAHHGAGIAYDRLGQSPQAIRMMEKAYSLFPKDRVIVHNTAWVLYKGNIQPRALKIVKDHLVANPSVPDEPLLNALLFMLENASPETRKTRLYTETEAFAQQYARSLERQVPGFARWGRQWIPVQTYEEKISSNKKVQSQADLVSDKIKRLEQDLALLNRQTPEIEMRVRRGFDHPYVLRGHLEQIHQLDDQRTDLIKERDQILERLELPPRMPIPDFLSVGDSAPDLPTIESLLKKENASSTTSPATTVPTDDPKKDPAVPRPSRQRPKDRNETSEVSPNSSEIKRVTRFGVAFAVSQDTLVTSHELVDGAWDITVRSTQGTTDEAKVVQSDPKSGLVLLRLSRIQAASLRLADDFADGPVECIAISNPDLFKPQPDTIQGRIGRPHDQWIASLSKNPRRPGAPLMSDGKVVGVTLAGPETQADSVPMVPLGALKDLIRQNPGTPGLLAKDPLSAMFEVVVTHEKKE
ncbi:MAG: hypothetical protein KatS3mg104_2900 [Phycisphaerae bacterium]|mgnify:CR=1 FL=1|jgi:Tfp pilus assembly protein PilF|nr:MAG: hypothetical protein KatS3mg104_2900 [Phycisphaerae bacterium]